MCFFKFETKENNTEPPSIKVEGISGLERLRRKVGPFPTEAGGFKPDLWKMLLGPGSINFVAAFSPVLFNPANCGGIL